MKTHTDLLSILHVSASTSRLLDDSWSEGDWGELNVK